MEQMKMINPTGEIETEELATHYSIEIEIRIFYAHYIIIPKTLLINIF